MQLFGLEITGDEITGEHVKLAAAVFGVLAGCLGFLAGRWSRHRSVVQFKHEDLVDSTVATELYGFEEQPDGRVVLHIVTQGGSEPFAAAFTNGELIRHIQRSAHQHPGLLQLKDAVAHRMMMDEGKDRITGLDAKANLDFMQGRPTREDEVLFGFAAYRENGDRSRALHDEVGRLVQMVVALPHVRRLADPAFIAALDVQHAGYRPRVARLHEFACEWLRLEALPASDRHAATDKIWRVTVRTSLG